MRPYTELLIKPASGSCNLRCRYCFYADEQKHRETASHGIMRDHVLEALVRKTYQNSQNQASFMFQGGEPTLAGLDFYRKLIVYEQKYNIRGIPTMHAIQTNGFLIDSEWASFFKENHFLVGLSIDGSELLHDKYRVDADGKGTHKKLMETVALLKSNEVDFNILTVVTKDIARNAKEVYRFYRENDLLYQQYIPCLNPFGNEEQEYSLNTSDYALFLKEMFDCWYEDIKNGRFIYNRYFENLVGIIKGYRPESCGMIGHCMLQYVVESDGSVYPCDFYALDQYCLGNLVEDSFDRLDERAKETRFVEDSLVVDRECRECKWLNLCRGGCRRDRETDEIGTVGLNRYCEAYKEFFEYASERLKSF